MRLKGRSSRGGVSPTISGWELRMCQADHVLKNLAWLTLLDGNGDVAPVVGLLPQTYAPQLYAHNHELNWFHSMLPFCACPEKLLKSCCCYPIWNEWRLLSPNSRQKAAAIKAKLSHSFSLLQEQTPRSRLGGNWDSN